MQDLISYHNKGLHLFRLNRYSELKELRHKIGEDAFQLVTRKVNLNLSNMRPGQVFQYTRYIPTEELEAFIKLSCLFIIRNPQYEFLDDYSAIKRCW